MCIGRIIIFSLKSNSDASLYNLLTLARPCNAAQGIRDGQVHHEEV